MKKLLIFVLLFAFIFTKANLRGEETAEEKKQDKEIRYEGYVEVPQATDDGTIFVFNNQKKDCDSMNNVATTKSPSFWDRLGSWLHLW